VVGEGGGECDERGDFGGDGGGSWILAAAAVKARRISRGVWGVTAR
jgi:hypothetical protein